MRLHIRSFTYGMPRNAGDKWTEKELKSITHGLSMLCCWGDLEGTDLGDPATGPAVESHTPPFAGRSGHTMCPRTGHSREVA